jgi:ribosomal protein S18 acetylase RimI-like enzyme
MTEIQQGIVFFTPENQDLQLVNSTEKDIPFLEEVYIQSRWEELAQVTYWTEDQKRDFLVSQFHAQKIHYDQHYIHGRFSLILFRNERAGRLYLYPAKGELRIVDISLLPKFRRRGIGTAILKDLIDFSVKHQADLTIHVEMFNPALALYERLGFAAEGELNGVYRFLRKKHKVAK